MFAVIFTSESSGAPGTPTRTAMRSDPTEFAGAPFASGDPTVMEFDDWTGGLHDGNASGGPCVRFGAAHALYAGTSDATIGVAPFGRGWVALAIEAITINPIAPRARASGSTILFLMVI
jgi:hypothetical protein